MQHFCANLDRKTKNVVTCSFYKKRVAHAKLALQHFVNNNNNFAILSLAQIDST